MSEYKYIIFLAGEAKPKTEMWECWSKPEEEGGKPTAEAVILGIVKWYGAWRKYAFFPETCTFYEQGCLRDIAHFLEEKTRLHKAGRAPTSRRKGKKQ